MSRPILILATAILATSATGCQIGYLWNQGLGQLGLSSRRAALDDEELLERLSPDARENLDWVPRILEFGRDELGLEPGNAYTTVLDLGGEPVSHVVVACHPRALIAYEWSFAIAGRVPYTGYFAAEDAVATAETLSADGWDAEVHEVQAYSTLGWFDDPILSTMLDHDLPQLVDLLLHETTHRTFYVPGSTAFNESFATWMAQEGTRLFLERYPQAFSARQLDVQRANARRSREHAELLARLRDDLDALYRSRLSDAEKDRRKVEIFATSSRARRILAPNSSELRPSNAHVVLTDRYLGLLPKMAKLQAAAGGHPRALMEQLKEHWERDPDGFHALFESR